MRPDLTDIAILLDESGSMGPIRHDTLGALNAFLEEQKKLPGEAMFTLATFSSNPWIRANAQHLLALTESKTTDDILRIRKDAVSLKDVTPLTEADYVPSGGTPLLDAIGTLIDKTGSRLAAMAEPDRPAKVLFVIVTDGQENASGTFTNDRIREMIKHQDEVYDWDFVYLGANQDAFAVAATYGIRAGNTSNFEATSGGVAHFFGALHASNVSYRSGQSKKGEYFAGANQP